MKLLLKKIPPKYFVLSQFALLFFGLIFLFGLHFLVNVQYKVSDNPFLAGPVTSKPKSFTLDLDQPMDDSLVFNQQILISGKTGPNMEVLISTQTQDLIIKSKTDGSFAQSFDLDEGVNNLKVVAFDKEGDSREESVSIYYSKEKI